MAITEHIEASGRWLFRWRGYLPLVIVVFAMIAIWQDEPFGARRLSQSTWEAICLLVSAIGMTIRVAAIGHAPLNTSGRNARAQRAASLNTTGVYSLVRHPLYLGNFFLMLGVVLFARALWLLWWYALSFWLYYERIMAAEESFLREQFAEAFATWSREVPAFIPRLSGWIRPELGFSLRNVLRREYNGFFAIFVSMFLMDVARNGSEHGRWVPDARWLILLGVSTAVWLVLRSLKRYTELLRVSGR